MFSNESTGELYRHDNKKLNTATMCWEKVDVLPKNLSTISHEDAVRALQKTVHKIKLPIGVIGSNQPTEKQYQIAEQVGEEIASLGFSVVCGGRTGIMEAVCKGVKNKNGLSIGLLPEQDIVNANNYVSIPLATGVGLARNSIIAASALCLVAIGGGYGTLSEIAYGLQFKKSVFTLHSNLTIEGTITCETVSDLIDKICNTILNSLKDNNYAQPL
jgi:uncharacterized protein (TIGR00725 family)